MKRRLAPVIPLVLSGAISLAAGPSLEGMGHPFAAGIVEIVWQVPTNALPAALPVLAALPGNFTPEFISNVVALADFKYPEKALAALLPASRGKRAVFDDPPSGKSLIVSPQTGYVEYFNRRAEALPGTPVQGVPSEAQALQRALSILPKLGINESDISHNPETHELEFSRTLGELGQFDKQARKVLKTTTRRGVILFRQFGGISFSGSGYSVGLMVDFANDAKIKALALSWRNLKVDRSAPVIPPSQVISRIREGKAVVSLPPESPSPNLIKKLTVQKFRPYYSAPDGSDPQTHIYPYAALRTVADFGSTNIVVTLNCPILK